MRWTVLVLWALVRKESVVVVGSMPLWATTPHVSTSGPVGWLELVEAVAGSITFRQWAPLRTLQGQEAPVLF